MTLAVFLEKTKKHKNIGKKRRFRKPRKRLLQKKNLWNT